MERAISGKLDHPTFFASDKVDNEPPVKIESVVNEQATVKLEELEGSDGEDFFIENKRVKLDHNSESVS